MQPQRLGDFSQGLVHQGLDNPFRLGAFRNAVLDSALKDPRHGIRVLTNAALKPRQRGLELRDKRNRLI